MENNKNYSPIEKAYLRYQTSIKRVIGRIVGSSDDVEDIAQKSFLKAVIAEKKGHIEDPKAYLFGAARNTAYTEVTKKSSQLLKYVEDLTDLPVITDVSAEDRIISNEQYALFCEAIAELPLQCRTVFLMCKVYGKSHKEVSAELDIAVSTIEKHVAAGLARCMTYIKSKNSENQFASAQYRSNQKRREK